MDLILLNKALTDRNVRGTEFKTLYLIANNCSMNKTQSIEMYNAFLMEKLHYGESTAKRCIKALEQNGYISVQRATQKRTPNIITLNDIKDKCKDECKDMGKDECRNDTLNNNIDKKIDNIQSIQSNSNEDNSIVGDKSNEEIHSIDPVNDNLNEDSEIDYEVYEEQQIAEEKTSYDSINNFNADNEELQGIRGIQSIGTETDNSNEDDHIDAMFEAYERGLIEAAEQSSTPRQGNNPNGIDWNAWRERFEQCKLGMLNAKCKTELELWKANCKESLKFAKKHMGPEKYKKQRAIFDNWYAASEPHFSYKEIHSPTQSIKAQPRKVIDEKKYSELLDQLDEVPEKEPMVKSILDYLLECGSDPKVFIGYVKKRFGITISPVQ